MFSNLNQYEKIFIVTPLLTLVLAGLLYFDRFVHTQIASVLLQVVMAILGFAVLLGYLYAYVSRFRYYTLFVSKRKKQSVMESTTFRERRLFDFCMLFMIFSFFLLIAVAYM